MNINKIKEAIKEVLLDKTSREITIYKPVVSYDGRIKNQPSSRYPLMNDFMWDAKKDSLIENHPDAKVIVNDEYRIVMLIEGEIEKDEK